ncbi:MAG TPA: tRNA pseudouridine(38-40) synthase TruA [Solirubrobacteraceae bacterium]|jgi:tRNA pseudouridine38-40 synthase|nr:tRNA pseudouridine(38-40) synthase TruA [Solirubrobacteraceae bacterium]
MPGPTSRLIIEYDGTDFAGWAKQPGRRTVQGELERALAIVLRRPEVALTVAGRTDAGVHARAQVASYAGEPARSDGVNALLPYDVAVLDCAPAAPGFDARRDATSRAYCYRVLTRRARSPHERRLALHWPHPIDGGALTRCAELVRGRHDFTAFTPAETEHVHFAREVMAAVWRPVGPDVLEFSIEADAFMRNMIRVLVGTMLEVGGGRRTVEQFAGLLQGRPRAEAGTTAPPHGLHFLGAGYGGERLIPCKEGVHT